MTAWLQHASSVTARALSWLPGWAVLGLLAALAAALAWQARRARHRAQARYAVADPAAAGEADHLPVPATHPADSAHPPQEAITHER